MIGQKMAHDAILDKLGEGGERLASQNNVTLVTNWFRVLRDTSPGS